MSPGGDHLFFFGHWSENIMMVTIWNKFSAISNFIMKAGIIPYKKMLGLSMTLGCLEVLHNSEAHTGKKLGVQHLLFFLVFFESVLLSHVQAVKDFTF